MPWYEHTSLQTTYQLMDIWAVSNLELLQIKLLHTFMNAFLYGQKVAILQDKYPDVQWLGYTRYV